MTQNTSHNPILLIHGYSADKSSFEKWKEILSFEGFNTQEIYIANYVTLTNEITINDLAEAFDRALNYHLRHLDSTAPFDAIVHSTGMLIIRAWLTGYASSKRRNRLKRLIGLAPATFGSPLAFKGRSWIGSFFKGNKTLGPDFLEAGDRILDNLEIGSSFLWELAHKDLIRTIPKQVLESIPNLPEPPKLLPFYGVGSDTPYVFTFCGTESFTKTIKRLEQRLLDSKGTDGTVRWAGCSLNTRKITIDFTKEPLEEERVVFSEWINAGVTPVIPVSGLNHGTILDVIFDKDDPNHPNYPVVKSEAKSLVEMVIAALKVSDESGMKGWEQKYVTNENNLDQNLDKWQQFIVRAVDERNEPITDYHIQLFSKNGEHEQDEEDLVFDTEVHTYSKDGSLRCFHINLTKLAPENRQNLWMRIIASSGTSLVVYSGYGSFEFEEIESDSLKMFRVEVDLSKYLPTNANPRLFYPFTTTLVEIRLDREPYPVEGKNKLFDIITEELSNSEKSS